MFKNEYIFFSEPKLYSCSFCQKPSDTAWDLVQHVQTSHGRFTIQSHQAPFNDYKVNVLDNIFIFSSVQIFPKKPFPIFMLLYEGIQICSERKTEANMATSSERSPTGPTLTGHLGAKKPAIPPVSFPGILPASGLMSPHGHSLSGMICQNRGDRLIIFPQ